MNAHTTYDEALRGMLGRLRYRIRKGIGDREGQEDMIARILNLLQENGDA